MLLSDLMEQKGLNMYQLSKRSGVPYTTISDLVSGKTNLYKSTAETVHRLSRTLGVSMETLIAPYDEERPDFELFKSNVCHDVRRMGDLEFILELLETDRIRDYYSRGWYPECLYLLGMLDYLSGLHNIPLCIEYQDLRCGKLEKTLYPADVRLLAQLEQSDAALEQARAEAIPEFLQFNIVESDIRNVV